MKLTDLRAELDRQADQIDGVGDLPLRAIRRKAAHIRGRRIAAVALTVGLVAALPPALGGVTARTQAPTVGASQTPTPSIGDVIGQPFPSVTPRPSTPRDVVRDGVRFPGTIGGDRLHAAAIGVAGQQTFTLNLTAPAGATEIRPLCVLDSRSAHKLQVLVNGRLEMTAPCGRGQITEAVQQHLSYPVGAGQPGVSAAGMTAGKRVALTVRVTGSHAPGVRIGVGVYRLGALAAIGNGLRIPRMIAYGGDTYHLGTAEIALASDRAKITLRTPANTPFLILTGASRYRPDTIQPPAGTRRIKLTGLGDTVVRSSRQQAKPRLPSLGYKLWPAMPARTAVTTYDGPAEPDFVQVLAVYRPAR